MLDEKTVRHIAKLARINLTDAEVQKFGKQLTAVLDYVKILEEVDTKNVAETSQVTGLRDIFQKDEVEKSPASREELLACTKLPVDSKQVRVMAAIKN